MSNFEKASNLASEWVESMGGLEAIRHDYGSDLSGLMQALDDAGLLAPDLPEPDVVKLCGDVKYFVDIGNQVRYDKGSKFVQVMNGSALLISETRNLAYALLAAADYAEKEQDNERS